MASLAALTPPNRLVAFLFYTYKLPEKKSFRYWGSVADKLTSICKMFSVTLFLSHSPDIDHIAHNQNQPLHHHSPGTHSDSHLQDHRH